MVPAVSRVVLVAAVPVVPAGVVPAGVVPADVVPADADPADADLAGVVPAVPVAVMVATRLRTCTRT